MDISFQDTITGLKAAVDIANSIIKLKPTPGVKAKIAELQGAILSAQSSALSANANQAAMVQEIRALKEEIARVKAWDTQKQHYQLYSIWEGGAVVYALKKSMSNSEPPHWICTKCYEDGRKSILNQKQRTDKNFWMLVCPACNSQIHSPYTNADQAAYVE